MIALASQGQFMQLMEQLGDVSESEMFEVLEEIATKIRKDSEIMD